MGVPSIGYLEACRETKNKNILGRRVGYSGEGGAREQIMAPGVAPGRK